MTGALKEEEEWRLRGSMLKSKALLLAIAYIGFISLGLLLFTIAAGVLLFVAMPHKH